MPKIHGFRDWFGDDKKKKDIERYTTMLEDESNKDRYLAALYLGHTGGPRALEVLIDTLKDPDAYVRARAAEAIGMIGGQKAIDILIAAMKDPDHQVRLRSSGGFGQYLWS